jgi:hypothetical protein
MGPDERSLPGVLCKRRGILYFAGEPDRIIGPVGLKDGNVRVSILLRRRKCSRHALWNGIYSLSCISASLRSSAIPLWPCLSDWAIPFS